MKYGNKSVTILKIKNNSYKEFRREKEKKYGTKFLYSTCADYLFRYPEARDSIGGLLYFSESVVK